MYVDKTPSTKKSIVKLKLRNTTSVVYPAGGVSPKKYTHNE